MPDGFHKGLDGQLITKREAGWVDRDMVEGREGMRDRWKEVVEKYQGDSLECFRSRPAVRAIIWDKSGGYCWYCGKIMNPFSEFSIDHLIPSTNGEDDSYENLVPCCRSCNTSKRGGDIETFRETLARKSGRITFTDSQIAFLQGKGIAESLPRCSDFIFWFEKEHGNEI